MSEATGNGQGHGRTISAGLAGIVAGVGAMAAAGTGPVRLDLNPLLIKFLEGATPVSIVLTVVCAVFVFMYWRSTVARQRTENAQNARIVKLETEREILTQKAFELGVEANKAGVMNAHNTGSATEELHELRTAIDALLGLGHQIYREYNVGKPKLIESRKDGG